MPLLLLFKEDDSEFVEPLRLIPEEDADDPLRFQNFIFSLCVLQKNDKPYAPNYTSFVR